MAKWESTFTDLLKYETEKILTTKYRRWTQVLREGKQFHHATPVVLLFVTNPVISNKTWFFQKPFHIVRRYQVWIRIELSSTNWYFSLPIDKSSYLQCRYCIAANRSLYIISVLRVILYVKDLCVLGFHDKGIDVQCCCGKYLGIVLSGW